MVRRFRINQVRKDAETASMLNKNLSTILKGHCGVNETECRRDASEVLALKIFAMAQLSII